MRYRVKIKDEPEPQIFEADDVDTVDIIAEGEKPVVWFNFTARPGDDDVTVAAIPFDEVKYVVRA